MLAKLLARDLSTLGINTQDLGNYDAGETLAARPL